jgi:hypothetical protein
MPRPEDFTVSVMVNVVGRFWWKLLKIIYFVNLVTEVTYYGGGGLC